MPGPSDRGPTNGNPRPARVRVEAQGRDERRALACWRERVKA